VYSFDDFRLDVKWRVRLLNNRLGDPEATWPGVLLLDAAGGLSADAYDLVGIARRELDDLAERRLPMEIRRQQARRFCWVMPVYREVGSERQECLLLVFGERGRIAASLAVVSRDGRNGPRLGRFSDGPFGGGARRVSGRFVEPLAAALY
jgi:hypothetical protein